MNDTISSAAPRLPWWPFVLTYGLTVALALYVVVTNPGALSGGQIVASGGVLLLGVLALLAPFAVRLLQARQADHEARTTVGTRLQEALERSQKLGEQLDRLQQDSAQTVLMARQLPQRLDEKLELLEKLGSTEEAAPRATTLAAEDRALLENLGPQLENELARFREAQAETATPTTAPATDEAAVALLSERLNRIEATLAALTPDAHTRAVQERVAQRLERLEAKVGTALANFLASAAEATSPPPREASPPEATATEHANPPPPPTAPASGSAPAQATGGLRLARERQTSHAADETLSPPKETAAEAQMEIGPLFAGENDDDPDPASPGETSAAVPEEEATHPPEDDPASSPPEEDGAAVAQPASPTPQSTEEPRGVPPEPPTSTRDEDIAPPRRDARQALQATPPATTIQAEVFLPDGESLFIRGDGPGLNWDQGVAMKALGPGQWEWTTHAADAPFRLRLLRNDTIWSSDESLTIQPGENWVLQPVFTDSGD